MDVYTYSEARQNFSTVLDKAAATGKVIIRRKDGRTRAHVPEPSSDAAAHGRLYRARRSFRVSSTCGPMPGAAIRVSICSHPGHRVLVQYKVIRLSELEGQRILDAGHVGLIAFAPLMKPPEGMASQVWLRHCIQAAQARPIARSELADYPAGMSLLSGLAYAPETISDVISKEGIMDLIRESSFARYLTQQGIEQGIEQGVERGIEQGLRESIVAVLEIRFDLSASHPLADWISGIDDVQRLKALLRAAIQISGPEAFGQLLDGEQP